MHSHIDYIDNEVGKKKGLFDYLSLKLLSVGSLFLGCIYLFAYITHEVVFENEEKYDNAIFDFFGKISTKPFVDTMKVFTFFGSETFLLPSYLVLIGYFLVRKKYRYSMHIAIIGSCSTALMFALKEATHRPRPAFPLIQGITNFSFPSGHTLSAFIFCSIFIYIIWYGRLREEFKWLFCTLLFLFAVTIGISRIVLKVHYPTDVIASLCLGMVWVILSFWILRRLSKRQALKLKASEPTQINP